VPNRLVDTYPLSKTATVHCLLDLNWDMFGHPSSVLIALAIAVANGCFYIRPPPVTTTTQAPVTTTAPPLTSCKCGQANRVSKIVGGVKTEANEYPWQVGLISSSSDKTPFCGGSLISNREILTAAHCTGNGIRWVVLGEHNLNVADGEQRVQVCSTINHPNYNSNTQQNDFAILRLCNPVTFTKTISPACLPSSSKNYDNVQAVVSGWGTQSEGGSQPSSLMEVNVNTMTNAQCSTSPMQYQASWITNDMICAGGEGGKDSCQGDSGGPLSAKESSGAYSLIGVVSWGIGCARSGYPGVYGRVTSALSWINSNMQGSTCPAT